MMSCIKCMSRIIAELKMVSNCTVCTLNFCCLSANNFEESSKMNNPFQQNQLGLAWLGFQNGFAHRGQLEEIHLIEN